MSLGKAVEPEDLFGAGPAGGAFFRVERQLGDVSLAHVELAPSL